MVAVMLITGTFGGNNEEILVVAEDVMNLVKTIDVVAVMLLWSIVTIEASL